MRPQKQPDQDRVVGAFEAKTHFSSLLEAVAQGEQIVITRHGKPIARLVPMASTRLPAREAVERLKALRTAQTLGADLDWKQLRDEGRKF